MLLAVSGCRVAYGKVDVLHDVSLAVGEGEAVALLGPNGAGKSSLLLAIAGALRCRAGHIELDGTPLRGLPPERIAERGLCLVPERRHVFTRLTVRENLEVGLTVPRRRGDAEDDGIARQLERFPDLARRIEADAGTLSGGEQQQLAIARALLARPRLLVLDEPSLGLAPQVVDRLFAVIDDLRAEGVTVLLTEQQARRALELADRSYFLREGRVLFETAPGEKPSEERLRAAYIGGASGG
jgi:branched-chain amino acid transport system ATP-binding protein